MIPIIKNIFSDIILLYKSFLHWNLSKIIILISSFLLGILLSLPVFLILAVVVYFDPIEWKNIIYNYYTTQTIGLSLLTALNSYFFYIVFEALFLFLAGGLFLFGMSYQIVLLSKLNLDYVYDTPTEYLRNYYFHFSLIWKYLGVLSWIGLLLIIPFFILLLILIGLFFVYGGIEPIYAMISEFGVRNSFSIISLSLLFMTLIIFIYLAYRVTFAYIIMLDEKNYSSNQKALYYIQESFRITSGVKIFKFILIMILFSLVMLPVDYLGEYVEDIGGGVSFLYGVFVFLLLSGVFEMILVSSYKNIMLIGNENVIGEGENKEELV